MGRIGMVKCFTYRWIRFSNRTRPSTSPRHQAVFSNTYRNHLVHRSLTMPPLPLPPVALAFHSSVVPPLEGRPWEALLFSVAAVHHLSSLLARSLPPNSSVLPL